MGTLLSSRIHATNGHSGEGMKLCFCYAAAVWSFVTIVSSCMTMLRVVWHLAWHCSSSDLTWETLWNPRIAPRWVVYGKPVKKDVIMIKWVMGSRQETESSWKNTCQACKRSWVHSENHQKILSLSLSLVLAAPGHSCVQLKHVQDMWKCSRLKREHTKERRNTQCTQ